MKTRCFQLVIALLLISLNTFTQENTHPASVVAKAEKEFASMSVATNTRDAFLKYYADEVIIFRNGKAVPGKKVWQDRKPDSSILWWEPVFADISRSGDFGYTTGPWEYWPKKLDTLASFYGYYNSVWKKYPDGNWHVVIDIGIPQTGPSKEKGYPVKYSLIKAGIYGAKMVRSKKSIVKDLENEFIRGFKKNKQAYKKFLSKESRVYRAGNEPYVNSLNFLSKNDNVTFDFIDGEVSASHDFAYAYGNATFQKPGYSKIEHVGYLRIWKLEADGKWKIVLDVVGDV